MIVAKSRTKESPAVIHIFGVFVTDCDCRRRRSDAKPANGPDVTATPENLSDDDDDGDEDRRDPQEVSKSRELQIFL